MTRAAGCVAPGRVFPVPVAVGVLAAILGLPACTGEKAVRLLEPRSLESTAADAATLPDAGGSGHSRGLTDPRFTACGRWMAAADPQQSLLMLVIDVSASMATQVTSQTTRWGVEQPVLESAMTNLPAAVGVGALYFPNMTTPPSTTPRPVTACVNVDAMIPVGLLGPSGSRQRSRLVRSLAMTQPSAQAGTPTLDAYLAGLEELGRTTLAGSRQILLITDGQATFSEGCVGTGQVDPPVDVTPILEAITATRRAGVKTFVIGAPGSDRTAVAGQDARPWLSRAAEAGGTALPGCSDSGPRYCHFDMTHESDFGHGFEASLNAIGGSLVQCDFPLPDPPDNERIDPQATNVLLTFPSGSQRLLPYDTSPGCTDGWRFSDDLRRIVLCDSACDEARTEAGAKVEFLFGCATVGRQDWHDPGSRPASVRRSP